jgi:hypothetical protein
MSCWKPLPSAFSLFCHKYWITASDLAAWYCKLIIE